MNNFLEFIEKDVEGKRAFLDSLPTKTKTNQKKFNEEIEKMIKKYEEYEANVYKYITVKAKSLDVKDTTPSDKANKEKVVALERVKFLLNPANTYLEKMGFDTLLYQINNYYTLNFKSLNTIINGFLDKFELAGIHLNSDDFKYTCYVHEYMTSYLEVRMSEEKDYTKLSEIFEHIYWLNPEIIQHIELNFRKLIKLNAKKFNTYISHLQKEEMTKHNIHNYKECNERLQTAYYVLNRSQVESIKDIIELSKAGVIEIEHYLESSKIRKQAYQSLIADAINLDDEAKMNNICDALEKLKGNINELGGYLEFLPLFKDFVEKYEKLIPNPSSKKIREVKEIEVQIAKKEVELEKLNKRISGTSLFGFAKKADDKDLKMESVMLAKELYNLYKEYDEAYFHDEVKPILSKTMTISDLLSLYYSFDYFKKIAIQQVYKLTSYDDVLKYSENFDLFAMNPNNVIIAGVPVFEETNIPRIICNKYRLSSIFIEEEDLSADNLKPLLSKVSLVLRTHKVEHSNTTLEKIWFITKVHKYTLQKEKNNEKN